MYICLCNAVTDRDFRAHAAGENDTVSAVYRSLGVKPKCGKCVPFVQQMLRQVVEVQALQLNAAVAG